MIAHTSFASLAVALLAAACCAPRSDPPSTPALASLDRPTLHDARCRTRDGGLGVDLDGRCLPVVIHASPVPGWEVRFPETHDPQGLAAVARASADGCSVASNVAIGDGAAFLHVWCGDPRSGTRQLVRIDPAGTITRVAVPHASFAQIAFVPGARPLVVAVLADVGTMAFDARTLAGLASWQGMGGWFNAASEGAAASPDGAWFAVPHPYGERIDIVRTADLTVAASLRIGDLVKGDHGPGRVVWSSSALEITTFRLPYE